MNTNRDYGRRGRRRRTRKNKEFSIDNNFQTSSNFKAVFANFNIQKLNKMTKINLQNFYRHDNRIIHCLICETNIDETDAFEHIVSSTHDFNKAFHNLVQKRYQSGDMDFIMNATWASCRYCNNVRIPTKFNDQRIKHIQSVTHSERKQYCLNRITGGGKSLSVVQPVPKSPDHRVKPLAKPLEQNNHSLNNKRHLAAGPSRGITEKKTEDFDPIQNVENLERKQYSWDRAGKNLAMEQGVKGPQQPNPKGSAQILRENQNANKLEVSKELEQPIVKSSGPPVKSLARPLAQDQPSLNNKHHLAAGPSREIAAKRTQGVSPIQKVEYLGRRECSLDRVGRTLAVEQSAQTLQHPSIKVSAQIRRENQVRVSEGRQLIANPSREVIDIKKEVISREPHHQSQVHGYQLCDSDSDYKHNSNRSPEPEQMSSWLSVFSCCFSRRV